MSPCLVKNPARRIARTTRAHAHPHGHAPTRRGGIGQALRESAHGFERIRAVDDAHGAQFHETEAGFTKSGELPPIAVVSRCETHAPVAVEPSPGKGGEDLSHGARRTRA